jgi:hypothetical protein
MQNLKNLKRIGSWIVALVITSSMAVACGGEGEKPAETTDTVVTPAPAVTDTTKQDSLPPVDTNATTRPDGKPTGGGKQ